MHKFACTAEISKKDAGGYFLCSPCVLMKLTTVTHF